jgi:crotonobetainyl-CoA:carnitine CoA-transferase CaiB-like acyl-CoA transferase
MAKPPLSGVRVIDLSSGVAGPYCARLLAGFGADVIKVETPGGDTARRMAPFARPEAGIEGSAVFLYLNTNKRGTVLDLTDEHGRTSLRELVKDASILIESFPPDYLESIGIGYRALERFNPGLVMTSITNFGQTGPYRDWQATELTLNALSGMMLLTGDPAREPVRLGLNQVQYTAGVSAAVATLAAYRYAYATGRGQQVDVALLDPMLNGVHQQLARYSYWGALPTRSWWGYPPPLFETADGWIFAPQARDPADMVAIMSYPDEVLQE